MRWFDKAAKKYLRFMRRLRCRKAVHICSDSKVTIISNNCIGGVLYSSVGLPFLSPTINMSIDGESFCNYVEHLRDYADAELVEIENDSPFVYGKLVKEPLPDVVIQFTHAMDFETAKADWKRRVKRIDYDRIYLVIEAWHEWDEKYLNRFLSLPFPKTVLASKTNVVGEHVRFLRYYSKEKKGRPVVRFVNMFGKRAIDEWDYVHDVFLYDFSKGRTEAGA